MVNVRIVECVESDELHCHHANQHQAQDVYLDLDLRDGVLAARARAEINGGIPHDVFHGFRRQYTIPVLTAEAANRVMAEIAPWAQRLVDDWEKGFDDRGDNLVADLGEDALAAEELILRHLEQDFAESDLVSVWDLDAGVLNGEEVEYYGITAETGEERLEEIAADITSQLAAGDPSPVVIVPDLLDHLYELRDACVTSSV
jgi:hypothetical protein